jgi:hypothetical protein
MIALLTGTKEVMMKGNVLQREVQATNFAWTYGAWEINYE